MALSKGKILVVGSIADAQFFRLKEEADNMSAELEGCDSEDLVIFTQPGVFEPKIKDTPLNNYDVIYLWTMGDRRWEWYVSATYLNKKYGTVIVDKNSILVHSGHVPTPTMRLLIEAENDLPFPKTAVFFTDKNIETIVKDFQFPVILKESMLHQGRGVYKADSLNELRTFVEGKNVPYPFLIREFIPNEGDIRVFTVGYKAVGAMKRTPKPGEYRSNISLGGTGENFDLSQNKNIKELAEKVASLCGVEIAGVDIMLHKNTKKPYILEINEGPQFLGIEKYTGINVASEIIKYFQEIKEKK